jgi:hypothetical protein
LKAKVVARLRWLLEQVRLLFDVRANPATFVYICMLIITSVVIAAAGERLTDALLRTQSTNLDNLRHHPVHVLFTSAFWLDSQVTPLLLVLPFALVLAPVERWIGSRRWLAVFAAGHVGATIVTAGFIQFELDHGWASNALLRTIDVGFSYGFTAVLGVFTYSLPRPWRLGFGAVISLALLIGVAISSNFTDIGHLVAWAIGLACRWVVPDEALEEAAEASTSRSRPFERA